MKRKTAVASRLTAVSLTAVLSVSALLPGCYGQFALTRKLYAWNGHVTGNPIARSAIMWAFLIIPVYELAGLGDFFIFNTVEVFSGSNPVADANGVRELDRDGHHYVIRPVGEDTFEVLCDGELTMRYRRVGEEIVVEGPEGAPRGRLALSAVDAAVTAPNPADAQRVALD